jgi:hypothetical protein
MEDDQTPATKADLYRLEKRFDVLEERFDGLDKSLDVRFKRVNEGIDRVLANLIHVKEDHERRIRRLEEHAGLVEV